MSTSASQTGHRANSRREFLKHTGRVAAASALAGVAVPRVHAAQDSTIKLALVGCGGRGTGAVANAFSTSGGPVKLVASMPAHGMEPPMDEEFFRLDTRTAGGELVAVVYATRLRSAYLHVLND